MIMYFKLTFFICLFCGKLVTHLPLSESFSRENMTHQEKLWLIFLAPSSTKFEKVSNIDPGNFFAANVQSRVEE